MEELVEEKDDNNEEWKERNYEEQPGKAMTARVKRLLCHGAAQRLSGVGGPLGELCL